MTSNNSNSSNNPFGAARPREAVLASLGVDHRESDRKVDEKAFYHHPHQYHQDTKPAYVHQTPYFHQSFDKDDDDWTHDTASITTKPSLCSSNKLILVSYEKVLQNNGPR